MSERRRPRDGPSGLFGVQLFDVKSGGW